MSGRWRLNFLKNVLVGNYISVVVGFSPFTIASTPIPQEPIPLLVLLLYVPSDVSSDLQKSIAFCLRISASLSYGSVMEFYIFGSVGLGISNIFIFEL